MQRSHSGGFHLGFVSFCAAVTGIGGFLFGYDTAVINGANTFLQQHFQLDPEKDSLLIGLATAAAIIGCVPGAMSAGFLSDRFGRRRILFLCALLYAVSGVLSAIPQNFVQFVLARMLSGVAIGVSSMICPVYIAEIAPPAWRGRLGTLFQLGIVIGIFITLFANLTIQSLGDLDWNLRLGWRWMLAAEALPALGFLLLLSRIPESPKWLIQAGREEEAAKTLRRIGGSSYAEAEVAAVREVLAEEQGSFGELFSAAYRLPLVIALVLMAGSQLCGINAIMYYSTDIFKNATGDAQAAFHSSFCIGLVNLLATFVAILLVDKAGRKPLLLVGNAVQVAALVTVGFLFAVNPHSPWLLWFVILYTGAFATAMGPLPWVICAEIFPAKLRGRAMSIATFTIWTACLLVVETVPICMKSPQVGPRLTFWIYAAVSAVTFLLILVLLPETKGKSLEEIEKSWRKHDELVLERTTAE
ncbi:MAG: sugar porter family MFS transporter [Thermoguttaceae bacterium]|jgi:sugar porter (SP) family MFS transporter